MAQAALPLTALSEAQRTQALERLEIISPAWEKHVSQAQVARTHHIPLSTIQLWIKRYRENGLAGLTTTTRSDKGKSRSLPEQAITLVEGLALQTPPPSAAAIHRQVVEIAKEQGWKPPSYERVRQIIKNLDLALVTLAHQGTAAYREEFDLVYRREATHANAMWQADHTPLDVWLLDEAGKPANPYLTAIEDDYSRMIMGYRLSFQKAAALTTALTLRQAIWRKEDPRWSACGIPSVFYTDHGSDFTSKHMGLMMQVEHVLVANQTQIVTKDVVETAQQNLIIGPGGAVLSRIEVSRNRSFVLTKRDTAHACGASLPLYHFPILLKSC